MEKVFWPPLQDVFVKHENSGLYLSATLTDIRLSKKPSTVWKICGLTNGYSIFSTKLGKYVTLEKKKVALSPNHFEWRLKYEEIENNKFDVIVSSFSGLYMRVKNKIISVKTKSDDAYEKWKIIVAENQDLKEYPCPKCEVKFTSDSLWAHWIEHISDPPFEIKKCIICNKVLHKHPKGFSEHLNEMHSPKIRLPSFKNLEDINKHKAYNFAYVIIQHPETKKFVIIEEIASQGWFLPAGKVEVGESFHHAAIRECKEEAGINVKLEGLLKIEYLPNTMFTRTKVIFFASPEDPNEPLKSTPDYESVGAIWISYEDLLEEVNNEKKKLRGKEALYWIEQVAKGHPKCPIDLLYSPMYSF